jgi:CBS domain containing-hemolysin-like protein
LPIYQGSLDNVTGFVLREDLLVAMNADQGDRKVSDFRRELMAVPDTTTLSRLMETLLSQRQHIAIVVGEYGETKGLVTLEDVVETLLGNEILDEGDKVEDMRQLARQLWAKRAERMGIDTKQE